MIKLWLMIIFLFLNLVILSAGILINRFSFKDYSSVDNILNILSLYFALIVLIVVSLGLSGHLDIFWIMQFSVIIFILTLLLQYANPDKPGWPIQTGSYLKSLFSKLTAQPHILIITVTIFWTLFIQYYLNRFMPDLGSDSLSYHLTFPAYWLKTRSLYTPMIPFADPSYAYSPLNGEIYNFWLLVPFRDDTLAKFAQAPFWLGLWLVSYSILRKLNVNKKTSYLASLLIFVLQPFLREKYMAYNDIMLAYLFMSVINYLLLIRERHKSTLIFLAVNIGLFLGIKYTVWAYIGTLGVIGLACLAQQFLEEKKLCRQNFKKITSGDKRRFLSSAQSFRGTLNHATFSSTCKKYIPVILYSALIIIVLGGFSYLRNFLTTSNPL